MAPSRKKRRSSDHLPDSNVDVSVSSSSNHSIDLIGSTSSRTSSLSTASLYIDHGDCQKLCEYCNAFFWFDERLLATSTTAHPRYNQCCKSGHIKLPLPRKPPQSLIELFDNENFRSNIRAYNSMFSMTSFGGKIDDCINSASAPYVFKIEGQVYHWLGSLCPPANAMPRFLQMYIYDTENEISNRLRFFTDTPTSRLESGIVAFILATLEQHNELVKLFRSAREVCQSADVPEFSIHLFNSYNSLCYDRPSEDCIGAIITDLDPHSDGYDIVIRHRDNGPQRVNKLHPLYMSLQYPLLFVYGDSGWSRALRLRGCTRNEDKNLTMNMFYSYQLHDRLNVYSPVLRGGRLFQQYLVDAYVCIEQSRLDYIRHNQSSLRSEILQGVHDAVARGDMVGRDIGKRIILPSSFTGGPRYMYKHYLDALAICRVHGNPQYFITFTCNVNWPEIQRYLAKHSTLKPQDRPDIVSRVFHIKVRSLINFLRLRKPFGDVAADLYTIEFQKRGLPHCHLLLWVSQQFRITTVDQIDGYISAEIPDPVTEPDLNRIVTDFMMHGPCGAAKSTATCMAKGSCSKNFPKNYEAITSFDKNGYARYKRRRGPLYVQKKGVALDNSYVVPYNCLLLLYFHAHINVEYCGWSMLIKYLFKYMSKGADRIRYSVKKNPSCLDSNASTNPIEIDEIKNFVDGRFICPHEAAWRIFDFSIHGRNPPVQTLSVHLENMQNVNFKDSEQLRTVLRNQCAKRTTLTEWLRNNQVDAIGRHLRYVDYLSEYRWDNNGRCWIRRSSTRTPAIGRLIYIHPSAGETFYLRMLLSHQKGCKSFTDIRTVNGHEFPTYRTACERLGLLGDDQEWSHTFEEASAWATSLELRYLFTHMLLYCEISNPRCLWDKHWRSMSDDVVHGHVIVNDDDLMQYVLHEIEFLLCCCSSFSLSDFGLPIPRPDVLALLGNNLLMEKKNYDRLALAAEHELLKATLHTQQHVIYDYVTTTIASEGQVLAFVYGHGGTGKTFLWTTIISALRSEGKIVLAVASSGIASLLLPSGRTTHSRFKIPLDLTEQAICHVKKKTLLSQLLTETTLIVWDEAPMNDRRCFESVDRTLRDLLNSPDKPFGGKSVLLGGDFRQTLPIKPKSSKSVILASSLPRSYLWRHFRIFKLTENMRLQRPNLSRFQRDEIASFSSWLLSIGDGALGTPDVNDPHNTRFIEIPPAFLISHSENSLVDLIQFIYDVDILSNPTASTLSEKAIVCPKNETAQEINRQILTMAPGSSKKYLSIDSIVPKAGTHADTERLYPTEYLNMLNFSGLPPHELELKVNAPVILIRNINQTLGLCNGTRLIVTQLLPRVIEAQIITGTSVGKRVYIPRISLTHTDKDLPFTFKRKQFPIKLCYAMTINKSQGQSLNKIGVYLPAPVFSHGQLYVAFSRATSLQSLKVLIIPEINAPENVTKNVVYSDFLREINNTQH